MSTTVHINQLQPADVLLMQGRGIVSDLIRIFDQGKYSHAAIYDGTNVVEMLSAGTTVNTVIASVGDARIVDVYRYVSDTGQVLGDPRLASAPVIQQIQFYTNNPSKYGYEQIVFLALLCSTRRAPVQQLSPFLAKILREILDSAAEELARMIHGNQTPMICSELVYLCFARANPPYPIHVRGVNAARMRAAALAPAIALSR
jgi:hypothetical protein